MVKDSDMINVRNMTDQIVSYIIPETRVRRHFTGFESKSISAGELRELWYIAGGSRLLQAYLCVENEELAAEFGVSKDSYTHEYSWTKKDIDDVLLNKPIDWLEDAFDFAPIGICETLVSEAIKLRIPDRNKHRLIEKITGRNISQMIEYEEKLDELNTDDNTTRTGTRRVGGNSNNKTVTFGRRVH